MPGPVLELRSAPFKAVIRVADMPGRKAREQGIVVAVGSRHDHGVRASVAEHGSFQMRQTIRLEVLDHLDQSGKVEASQARVAIDKGTLKQLQLALERVRKVGE